jgi:hypothetical protein
MCNVHERAVPRNIHKTDQLDLFHWCQPPIQCAPVAARRLARRYGLSIAHAVTVATLAGVGGTEARQ